MNNQKLVMKYHPSKKRSRVSSFPERQRNDKVRNDSRLRHYMNLWGSLSFKILEIRFLMILPRLFDGLKVVDIEVATTKLDYEDFRQMAEYYNEDSKCKMNPTLLAELPDMNQTFEEVVKYGENAIGKLEAHRQKLFEIPLENENVKEKCRIILLISLTRKLKT